MASRASGRVSKRGARKEPRGDSGKAQERDAHHLDHWLTTTNEGLLGASERALEALLDWEPTRTRKRSKAAMERLTAIVRMLITNIASRYLETRETPSIIAAIGKRRKALGPYDRKGFDKLADTVEGLEMARGLAASCPRA